MPLVLCELARRVAVYISKVVEHIVALGHRLQPTGRRTPPHAMADIAMMRCPSALPGCV
jgi:hypothetical protein